MKFIILLLVNAVMCLACVKVKSQQNKTQSFSHEATIYSLQKNILDKKISCEELINNYIDRIKHFNLNTLSNQASLNAIVAINENAIEQARTLDLQFKKSNQLIDTLHCIPVVIKDNINSYDINATSGSLSLLGNQATSDATIVQHMRNAGAIILATTSMDEFASGMSGFSSKSGRIGNAYNPSQNSGGSSGGSAVAVSANFSILGIGTDNSGSIRIPAAFNGIVGLRPTTGLISQNGIFPRGNLDGIAGPMARNATDLAILLDVISREDAKKVNTDNHQQKSRYHSALNKNALQKKRIGIVQRVGDTEPFKDMPSEIKSAFEQATEKMQKSGAVIVPNIIIANYNTERLYNQAGEREDINNYLKSFPSVRQSYKDICESKRSLIFSDTKSCLAYIKNLPNKNSAKHQKALEIFKQNRRTIETILKEQNLDALLLPVSTTGSATYNSKSVGPNELIASNAGLPAITFPISYTQNLGMPIGVELIGKQYDEAKLISIAYGYEQNSFKRIAPRMPAQNAKLIDLNISELNNLYATIGYNIFEELFSKKDFNASKYYQNQNKINQIVQSTIADF